MTVCTIVALFKLIIFSGFHVIFVSSAPHCSREIMLGVVFVVVSVLCIFFSGVGLEFMVTTSAFFGRSPFREVLFIW